MKNNYSMACLFAVSPINTQTSLGLCKYSAADEDGLLPYDIPI